MNERSFVSLKSTDWDTLRVLLEKAEHGRGLRSLSRDQIQSLGPLYRRVSSDLAYAQAHAVSDDLILHLNGLVGRAYALLYRAERSRNPIQSFVRFYLFDFPALLQKHVRLFLTAILLTFAGGFFAYGLVAAHPSNLSLFIPKEFESSVDKWKSGTMNQEPLVEGASMYMTHNSQVGMTVFATGPLAGIPTTSLLFENGAIMGAMIALMSQVHQHQNFWPGILPHGIAELSAIMIDGAAGLLIGLSLLFPGKLRRSEAFRAAGLDGIKLALGSLPLFVFAGVIEAMFSRLEGVSAGWRYAFSAVNGVIWYLYLFLPRPKSLQNLMDNLPNTSAASTETGTSSIRN